MYQLCERRFLFRMEILTQTEFVWFHVWSFKIASITQCATLAPLHIYLQTEKKPVLCHWFWSSSRDSALVLNSLISRCSQVLMLLCSIGNQFSRQFPSFYVQHIPLRDSCIFKPNSCLFHLKFFYVYWINMKKLETNWNWFICLRKL